MELWEYQVIHLNVEAPQNPPPAPKQPPPPPRPDDPAAATRPEAVFSREYLEKEFPGFYGGATGSGQPSQEHPAVQLRGFLNGQGRDGWQLLGFYPVGQLVMMIFRRPLRQEASSAAGQQQRPAEAPTATPSPGSPNGADDRSPELMAILERLEQLERRLAGSPTPASGEEPAVEPASAAPLAPEADGDPAIATSPLLPQLTALADGEILTPELLADLHDLPRCSTAQAARGLGFRSPATLLNRATRSGYQPGLIKHGSNGRVAVYIGQERNDRGGRNRRWWVVLAPEA